jgi:hypothetical protein
MKSALIKSLESIFKVGSNKQIAIEEKEIPFLINEAVNIDKQLIFVAIPKTGTTSIRNQISQEGNFLVDNAHLNIRQIQDLIYCYLLKQTLGTNRQFPNNTHPSDEQIRAEANKMFTNFFKFSAVRNPWARTVSIYFRREGVRQREKLSFEEFCEAHTHASDTCQHPTLHKNQIDWLSAADGKIWMDYIYKVEEMDKAIVEIKERTNGRLILDNRTDNQNPDSRSNDYQALYNSHTRKLIAQRFEKDIDYFKYVF